MTVSRSVATRKLAIVKSAWYNPPFIEKGENMPGIGKLVDGVSGPGPEPGFWRRQWLQVRQTLAIVALIHGLGFWVVSGLMTVDFIWLHPDSRTEQWIPAVLLVMIIARALTLWGWRTASLKTLVEMSVIGLVCAGLAGASVEFGHVPRTEGWQLSGGFLALAGFFYLMVLRKRREADACDACSPSSPLSPR